MMVDKVASCLNPITAVKMRFTMMRASLGCSEIVSPALSHAPLNNDICLFFHYKIIFAFKSDELRKYLIMNCLASALLRCCSAALQVYFERRLLLPNSSASLKD